MSHKLLCEIDWENGTLQRLVGLIERRGFEVITFELLACGGARRVLVKVQPSQADRDIAVLRRQIDRLYGVTRLDDKEGRRSFAMRHRSPLVG